MSNHDWFEMRLVNTNISTSPDFTIDGLEYYEIDQSDEELNFALVRKYPNFFRNYTIPRTESFHVVEDDFFFASTNQAEERLSRDKGGVCSISHLVKNIFDEDAFEAEVGLRFDHFRTLIVDKENKEAFLLLPVVQNKKKSIDSTKIIPMESWFPVPTGSLRSATGNLERDFCVAGKFNLLENKYEEELYLVTKPQNKKKIKKNRVIDRKTLFDFIFKK